MTTFIILWEFKQFSWSLMSFMNSLFMSIYEVDMPQHMAVIINQYLQAGENVYNTIQVIRISMAFLPS